MYWSPIEACCFVPLQQKGKKTLHTSVTKVQRSQYSPHRIENFKTANTEKQVSCNIRPKAIQHLRNIEGVRTTPSQTSKSCLINELQLPFWRTHYFRFPFLHNRPKGRSPPSFVFYSPIFYKHKSIWLQ